MLKRAGTRLSLWLWAVHTPLWFAVKFHSRGAHESPEGTAVLALALLPEPASRLNGILNMAALTLQAAIKHLEEVPYLITFAAAALHCKQTLFPVIKEVIFIVFFFHGWLTTSCCSPFTSTPEIFSCWPKTPQVSLEEARANSRQELLSLHPWGAGVSRGGAKFWMVTPSSPPPPPGSVSRDLYLRLLHEGQ